MNSPPLGQLESLRVHQIPPLHPTGFKISPVSGRLRPDPDSGKVLLEQVPNEGGFSGGVLADEHHHRLGVEVRVVQSRRVEVVEVVPGAQKLLVLSSDYAYISQTFFAVLACHWPELDGFDQHF